MNQHSIKKITRFQSWAHKNVCEIDPRCHAITRQDNHSFKPASNDLGVYVNKFGKTSVVWRYTLQSIGRSGIALNY